MLWEGRSFEKGGGDGGVSDLRSQKFPPSARSGRVSTTTLTTFGDIGVPSSAHFFYCGIT